MADHVIISRHPAAIEFVRSRPEFADAPVVAQATPEDVAGKVVAGNLPLNLAALAAEVWAVEFTGNPPRGQEYTLADMQAAGATLRRYRVVALEEPAPQLVDRVLVKARSTNGRWGVDLVGSVPDEIARRLEHYAPWRGTMAVPGYRLDPVGSSQQIGVFRLSPDATTIAVVGNDLRAVADAEAVGGCDLQSGDQISLLNARPGAVVRLVGYRGRSSRAVRILADGSQEDVPPHVLLAMQAAGA